MKKLLYIFLLLSLSLNAQQLAFPSAIGGGAYTTGGRGGTVLHVDTLNDSGNTDSTHGSFRWALLQEFTRTIVFDVSGRIDLLSIIEIPTAASNFTVAGQTAPEGGITITGFPISMGGTFNLTLQVCNNVIWRYVRFRNGSIRVRNATDLNDGDTVEEGKDFTIQTTGTTDFTLLGASNSNVNTRFTANSVTGLGTGTVIRENFFVHKGLVGNGVDKLYIDHCSFSFNNDKAISLDGTTGALKNVTIDRNLFSQNGTGMIVGLVHTFVNGLFTFVNNLFVNQSHRLPNTSAKLPVDIINNVMFNWEARAVNIKGLDSNMDVNFIGNYMRIGDAHNAPHDEEANHVQSPAAPIIYTAFNYHSVLYTSPVADDEDIWTDFSTDLPLAAERFTSSQHTLVGESFTIKTALNAYDDVTDDVGNNKHLNADGSVSTYLDTYDTDLISDVLASISSDPNNVTDKPYTQPTIPENTRAGSYDTDNDGMADVWETATFGDLTKDGTADTNGDGYTDLERFLNGVDNQNTTYDLSTSQKQSGRLSIKKLVKINN